MKVCFMYDVDFLNLPTEPPTRVNCEKCAFYISELNCMRTDMKICNFGSNGYFVKNKFFEVAYGENYGQ